MQAKGIDDRLIAVGDDGVEALYDVGPDPILSDQDDVGEGIEDCKARS